MTDHESRLHRLIERFIPHVRQAVNDEVCARLLLPEGRLCAIAEAFPGCGPSAQTIICRALAGETRLIVMEWTSLLAEHAHDAGRIIRLSTLDEAMLPEFTPDLQRMFQECSSRRAATQTLTRDILGSVRQALPPGEIIPADAVVMLERQGIRVTL